VPAVQGNMDSSSKEPGIRRLAPILFLIFLTPMVEFLTGSTSFAGIISNPLSLILFVLVTEPIYILPVLLIREAIVAWKKGPASLLSLGIAYGGINEGLAAKTYFTFSALSPVLGSGQGRWLGVNWPWVTEITLFHMIVSMSVPVALSFLIFPETRSERFFTEKAIRRMLGLLIFLIVSLNFVEYVVLAPGLRHNLPLLLLPTGIILVFVYLAYRLPPADPKRQLQRLIARPVSLYFVSLLFFEVIFMPVLFFFSIRPIPVGILPAVLYHTAGQSAIVLTLYPALLAALAIWFFARYSLSQVQLLAIIAGVMTQPILSAITLFNLAQGAPVAGLIYLTALLIARKKVNGNKRHLDSTLEPSQTFEALNAT
jgi:hypothetical protein